MRSRGPFAWRQLLAPIAANAAHLSDSRISHDMPNFRVRGGKVFATYAVRRAGVLGRSYRHFALKKMVAKLPESR